MLEGLPIFYDWSERHGRGKLEVVRRNTGI